MNDFYLYIITALLPLSAALTVLQVNPYHALIIRGILGAVAALVYAMFGAADVALTEALVGTMLAITLYGVAVRSSMVMRLGMIKNEATDDNHFKQLIDSLSNILSKYHLRLELVSYNDKKDLEQALDNQEIHGTCELKLDGDRNITEQPYHTITRVQRLYEIIKQEISSSLTHLTYIDPSNSKEKKS
ncbi:MAG: DUF4040 domain-containing protein [Crocosphaera sp.]|jgi:putative multicomponent Na+:H+ antiporter subunit B